MKEKVFFWSVKEMTNDYWTMYSIWIKKDDLDKLVFTDKWWANLSMKQSKNGNWYMEVYEWKSSTDVGDKSVDEWDTIPF